MTAAGTERHERVERLGDRPDFAEWMAEVEAALDLREARTRAGRDDQGWRSAPLRLIRRARLH